MISLVHIMIFLTLVMLIVELLKPCPGESFRVNVNICLILFILRETAINMVYLKTINSVSEEQNIVGLNASAPEISESDVPKPNVAKVVEFFLSLNRHLHYVIRCLDKFM